jgi:hypothetical protein
MLILARKLVNITSVGPGSSLEVVKVTLVLIAMAETSYGRSHTLPEWALRHLPRRCGAERGLPKTEQGAQSSGDAPKQGPPLRRRAAGRRLVFLLATRHSRRPTSTSPHAPQCLGEDEFHEKITNKWDHAIFWVYFGLSIVSHYIFVPHISFII